MRREHYKQMIDNVDNSNMEQTLQYNRTQTIIAVIYMVLMVAFGCWCAYTVAQHTATSTHVESATYQWTSDTSWVGGWQ